ncbi:rhomboid family intramembrane serine protease [Fulvivirgaceae bacterium BMA12]|uniref:Rhomboid family intramembrane serine protease n=1 Tax=Agaribacillus aureus TaxID=3051825 RepID=A0ABT8L481_9BACT|nr:rhomboid family intramembrane serine protease [Fulvivirgaceae bacterium BMA12]
MFKSIVDDFRYAWNRPNNGLQRIIIINALVFIIVNLVQLFASQSTASFIIQNIILPTKFDEVILKPWTLVTSFYTHEGFGHIFWNMIFFYWFGKLIFEYLGNTKLINLYILGGLAGSISVLILFNLVPKFAELSGGYALGASAAVFAVSTAAATLLPDFSFHLFFIGPVKIKYIVGIQIFLALIGLKGHNVGGEVAHLAGAFIGYFYISQMQKGRDLGGWLNALGTFFKSFFVKQSNIKVSYKRKSGKKASKKSSPKGKSAASQDEIDAILDKINASGYESLTKEEKQKLFNAGEN